VLIQKNGMAPNNSMVDQLRADYRAMTRMIFGDPSTFDDVLARVAALEERLNDTADRSS
jgi:hypothetical protein